MLSKYVTGTSPFPEKKDAEGIVEKIPRYSIRVYKLNKKASKKFLFLQNIFDMQIIHLSGWFIYFGSVFRLLV